MARLSINHSAMKRIGPRSTGWNSRD
ncbi:glutamyl-Q tRNA(Asp) synthetase, partial [Yersinia pestis PY-93]